MPPTPERDFAVAIVERLRDAGHVAYWAGGCVRDRLLGRPPKDYDVATSATPPEIRKLFGRRKTLAIGASFGVITVLGSQQEGQLEVATFREDATYSDGRHPDHVTFSTPEQDALRRDFTINGLFYDPLADKVIDYVGGRDDLAAQIVRAIGDPRARIGEDKLRMLRAVRFAATLEFELETGTLDAVREMADQLDAVSAERIAAELRRMLTHATRRRAVELLQESALLSHVLPELADTLADAGAWEATLVALEKLGARGGLTDPSLPLALATLLHRIDSAAAVAAAVGSRLRLSNREIDRTTWLLAHLAEARRGAALPWPRLQRLLIAPGGGELVALVEALDGADAPAADHCRAKLALPPAELNPPPLLTGDDLIAHGVAPGPAFRTLLEQVRDAQLEGKITDRAAALTLIDELRR